MIRRRRNLTLTAGVGDQEFAMDRVWKFRAVVTCPPGELVRIVPVLEGSPKDALVFGPGDTGWIEFSERYSGLRIAKESGSSSAAVDLWVATDRDDRVYPAPASSSLSPMGSVLYDSGSVAAGAAIDSGVLDLTNVRELGIVVDNTAGAVLRDLSLLSYLADGATLIDTVLLRRVAFGAAANGATHDPGRVRGVVGPNPPGGVSGVHLLYDATTPVNTAIDATIVAEEASELTFSWLWAPALAGGIAFNLSHVADDGVSIPASFWTVGAAGMTEAQQTMGVSLAAVAGRNVAIVSGFVASGFAARRLRMTLAAAGAGVTSRMVVYARGRVPGTFSVPLILPPRARLQLAAAGAAAARLTVFAR